MNASPDPPPYDPGAYQVTTSLHRVCAYSLKEESDLPPGKKLLVCSKCFETCYVNREMQKLHWPFHKKVCCAVEKDPCPYVRAGKGFESFRACTEHIYWLLDSPRERIKGRSFVYALQQFRRFLMEDQIYFGKKATQKKKIEDLCFSKVLKKLRMFQESFNDNIPVFGYRGEKIWLVLWASPGFANFIMSDKFLLSPAMKELKDQGLPPPKPERFMSYGRIDPDTRLDPKKQHPAPFANFIHAFFLLTTSAVQKSETGIGAGVMAKTMRLWHDPYARASFPSFTGDLNGVHVGPDAARRCEFFYSLWKEGYNQQHIREFDKRTYMSEAMNRFTSGMLHKGMSFEEMKKALDDEWLSEIAIQKWMKKDELIPGLTVPQILKLLMKDEAFFFSVREICYSSILHDLRELLFGTSPGNWAHVPFEEVAASDRVELLNIYLADLDPRLRDTSILPKSSGPSDLPDLPDLPPFNIGPKSSGSPKKIHAALLQLITANSTKELLKVYHSDKESMKVPATKETSKLIQKNYSKVIATKQPLIMVYLQEIEPRYRRKLKKEFNEEGSGSFPDELIGLIAEYLLPEETIWVE